MDLDDVIPSDQPGSSTRSRNLKLRSRRVSNLSAFNAESESVLQCIGDIRHSSQLRQSFVSGTSPRPVVSTALKEVRQRFSPKEKASRVNKGKGPMRPRGASATKKSKKRRPAIMKRVLRCLPNPSIQNMVTREEMARLCERELGRLWMSSENPAEIPLLLDAEESHCLLLSIYPALFGRPYELCKLGGSYHNVIEPLDVPTPYTPQADTSFITYWTPELLGNLIGKRAQLIIRPLSAVSETERLTTLHPVIFMFACTH